MLPIKGKHGHFTDIALKEGDTVLVEALPGMLFSVIGLVQRPGNYPYPPDTQYNLMQALAFAGGIDRTADPRYATIYRLDAEGNIANVTFSLDLRSEYLNASSIHIKPGDIVAVEHTKRTRSNEFFHQLFRVNFGIYAPLYTFSNND